MENICMNIEELNSLELIGSGKEGSIYKYEDKAIKIFNKDVTMETKFKKILLLHDTPLSSIITIPEKTITIDENIKGYQMEYKENYKTLKTSNNSFEEKIKILENIKTIIKILHSKDIIVGDVRRENILIKDNDIIICDSDNFKIGGINPEILNIYSKEFYYKYKTYDERLDIFSFNVMTLLYLFNASSEDIILYVKNTDLIKEENIKTLFNDVLNNEFYTKNFIVDELSAYQKRKTN